MKYKKKICHTSISTWFTATLSNAFYKIKSHIKLTNNISFPGLLLQMATNWGAEKNRNLFSNSSRGWKSETEVLAGLCFLPGLSGRILPCPVHLLVVPGSHSLVWSCLTSVSTSVFTWPPTLSVWLPLKGHWSLDLGPALIQYEVILI